LRMRVVKLVVSSRSLRTQTNDSLRLKRGRLATANRVIHRKMYSSYVSAEPLASSERHVRRSDDARVVLQTFRIPPHPSMMCPNRQSALRRRGRRVIWRDPPINAFAHLRFGHGLDDVRVTGVGDGHAGHAVVATARRAEVHVVCEERKRRAGSGRSVSGERLWRSRRNRVALGMKKP